MKQTGAAEWFKPALVQQKMLGRVRTAASGACAPGKRTWARCTPAAAPVPDLSEHRSAAASAHGCTPARRKKSNVILRFPFDLLFSWCALSYCISGCLRNAHRRWQEDLHVQKMQKAHTTHRRCGSRFHAAALVERSALLASHAAGLDLSPPARDGICLRCGMADDTASRGSAGLLAFGGWPPARARTDCCSHSRPESIATEPAATHWSEPAIQAICSAFGPWQSQCKRF